MPELKPCPFCGGEAEEDATACAEYYGHDHQDYTIRCKSCKAQIEIDTGTFAVFPCSCCHDTRAEAIARWNKRQRRVIGYVVALKGKSIGNMWRHRFFPDKYTADLCHGQWQDQMKDWLEFCDLVMFPVYGE
jgi:hypothetical protein